MKKYQIGLTAVIVCMGIILTACTNKTLEKKEEDILPKQEIMKQDNQTKETIIQGKLMETTEVYQVYELNLEREGLKIFGNLLKPRGEEQYPLMILSHGFGSSYRYTLQYARELVELGIACYVFDFCGGSMNSMSDGEMINMSVITEKNDLSTILDQLKMYDWVDQDKIYLMGESQGGLVSTLLASERSDEIDRKSVV